MSLYLFDTPSHLIEYLLVRSMICMIILILSNLHMRGGNMFIKKNPIVFRRQVCIFLDQELSCGSSVSDSLYGTTNRKEGSYYSNAQRTDKPKATTIDNNQRNTKCCHSNRQSMYNNFLLKNIFFYFYFFLKCRSTTVPTLCTFDRDGQVNGHPVIR